MRREHRQGFNRWLRSLVCRDVLQRRQCSVTMMTLGEGDGQWAVCPADLRAGTIVYSFGIGHNVTFERALIERFGVVVHAFDPTPLALEWIKRQALPPSLVVHEVGIADYDGTARFAPPRRAGRESFSMVRASGVGTAVEVPVARLATLVSRIGGAPPEILKLDVEGIEYRVLPDLLASGFRPRQLLVEFHHRWAEVGAKPTRVAIRLLNEYGYRVAAVAESGREYSFILC